MTTGPIKVRKYTQLSELEVIAVAWDELVLSVGRPPMLSWSWVATHLEYGRATNREWFCLAAFDNSALIGVLPLVPETITVFAKTVTILRQPTDPHTRSVDAVILNGREQEVLDAFREELDKAVPGWFALELISLDQASPFVTTTHLSTKQSIQVSVKARYASVCATDVDWDDYFAGLSSNFRQRLRKHRKRLSKLGAVTAEYYFGTEVRSEHLDIFMAIEASGWKGRKGSAIGENGQLIRFYRVLLERLQRSKSVEWHFLTLDDVYIAGHLIIHTGRVRTIWKIGYVEKYSRYSPGALLMEESLRYMCHDPDVDVVDFVTDREWHNSWRPQKALYHDVWVYPRRPYSVVFGAWPRKLGLILRSVPGLKRAVKTMRSLVKR